MTAETEMSAGARFMVINLVRVTGVIMILVGVLILRGVIETVEIAGYALLAVGLADVFVVPQILARKWRTPPGSTPDIDGVGPRSGE